MRMWRDPAPTLPWGISSAWLTFELISWPGAKTDTKQREQYSRSQVPLQTLFQIESKAQTLPHFTRKFSKMQKNIFYMIPMPL